MLSFAKFRLTNRHFRHGRILCFLCYSYGSFSKEFLLTPVLYLCFAISTGGFSKEFLLTLVLYLCSAVPTGGFSKEF